MENQEAHTPVRHPTVKELALVYCFYFLHHIRDQWGIEEINPNLVAGQLGLRDQTNVNSRLIPLAKLYFGEKLKTSDRVESLIKKFRALEFLPPLNRWESEEEFQSHAALLNANRKLVLEIITTALNNTQNTDLVSFLIENNIDLHAGNLLLDINPVTIIGDRGFMSDLINSNRIPDPQSSKSNVPVFPGEKLWYCAARINLGWYYANHPEKTIINFSSKRKKVTPAPDKERILAIQLSYIHSEEVINKYRKENLDYEKEMILTRLEDLLNLIGAAVELSALCDFKKTEPFKNKYYKWSRAKQQNSVSRMKKIMPDISLVQNLIKFALADFEFDVITNFNQIPKTKLTTRLIAESFFILVFNIDLVLAAFKMRRVNPYDEATIRIRRKLIDGELPNLEEYLDAHIRSAWVAAQQALRTLHSNE